MRIYLYYCRRRRAQQSMGEGPGEHGRSKVVMYRDTGSVDPGLGPILGSVSGSEIHILGITCANDTFFLYLRYILRFFSYRTCILYLYRRTKFHVYRAQPWEGGRAGTRRGGLSPLPAGGDMQCEETEGGKEKVNLRRIGISDKQGGTPRRTCQKHCPANYRFVKKKSKSGLRDKACAARRDRDARNTWLPQHK